MTRRALLLALALTASGCELRIVELLPDAAAIPDGPHPIPDAPTAPDAALPAPDAP